VISTCGALSEPPLELSKSFYTVWWFSAGPSVDSIEIHGMETGHARGTATTMPDRSSSFSVQA
jgi:hypothetical protein